MQVRLPKISDSTLVMQYNSQDLTTLIGESPGEKNTLQLLTDCL